MNKDFKLKGHLAMLGANTTWGMMAPIAKIVMTAGVISPLLLTNFRIIGAALLFWTASIFTKYEHVPLRDLLRMAGAGMLGIVFNQGSYITGIGFTSPGEASIITTTMPIWVMLLAAVILKEPITWKKAGGIALGASGALLLVFGGAQSAMKGDNPMLGDLLVLTAQLSYALYLTFYKNFIKKYSVFTLMKWMFTFASIVILPISIKEWNSTDWSAVSHTEIAGIAYVVVIATFLAYILTMIGQKNLRPTLVGMYNYVQPIIASLIGVYLGLDRFTPVKVVAVALIFSGVYLVTISKAAKHHTEAAS
ncbi:MULTISPECIES: DMT family transporter [Duncaniella]|jgi:drug/metabolite transporter (DMT)-like permease|uniref:EamA/RhaT family transporter n=4 Tax=Duncaniella TaxID=2518495 RepID=A0A4P7W5D8_9BACT|nr:MULTISPECIES: DMT family transporter [Duncaniella]MBJ2189273.1 EamA family transporter [Muribaculaceae bacterium]ROS87970.1 EamA/RhaT family transporter [Muribaculaceae bacterium Isolate-080 (Janvier)]HBN63103.1 EamA family transporter [Porphyromonadaceae bacterium]MCX4283641.1 DMT family transporter [Duncaniella dubosii]QCD43309.1 EamA/RhaT family transporter [Duncaniella dubosii]